MGYGGGYGRGGYGGYGGGVSKNLHTTLIS
jgi:hypothetical protein